MLKGECSYIDAICCHDYHCIGMFSLQYRRFFSLILDVKATLSASSKPTGFLSVTLQRIENQPMGSDDALSETQQ